MRKNTSFAVIAAIMGLSLVFWAKSSVVASSADVRSKMATSSYVGTPGPYLPFQVLEPNF